MTSRAARAPTRDERSCHVVAAPRAARAGASLAPWWLVFEISLMKVLEILLRVTVIYVSCMVLLRLSGRRELSEMGPMDLLAMLLLSETVSPALVGGDQSITAGIIAATALMGLCVGTSLLSYRHRRIAKVVEGEAVVLIDHGRVRPDVLRKFRISSSELEAALHQHGLLHVAEVARAYVESDGDITIIKRKDFDQAQEIIRDHRSHAPARS
jgi:uncharacterized membrane protein YcaP (DUF421 family)